MEIQDSNQNKENSWKHWEGEQRRGKVAGGIIIVIFGLVFLLRSLGAEIPHWIVSWKTILIAVGFYIGFKHRFRHAGWLVLVLIGSVFLVTDFFPHIIHQKFLWPIAIIGFGLYMIFKPSRNRWTKWHKRRYGNNYMGSCEYETPTGEDRIASDVFFGSTKKTFVTKDFKGGEISVVFGGAELNLTQADFNTSATLDVSVLFGGAELIIPANWKVRSEMTTVLGSVEDKRPILQGAGNEPEKTLILKGSVFLGGLEIKSY